MRYLDILMDMTSIYFTFYIFNFKTRFCFRNFMMTRWWDYVVMLWMKPFFINSTIIIFFISWLVFGILHNFNSDWWCKCINFLATTPPVGDGNQDDVVLMLKFRRTLLVFLTCITELMKVFMNHIEVSLYGIDNKKGSTNFY